MKNYLPIKILLTQFTGNQADNYQLTFNLNKTFPYTKLPK
jgi:hypothetical protein